MINNPINRERMEHGRQLAGTRFFSGFLDFIIAGIGMFFIHGCWGNGWYTGVWAVSYLLLKDSLPQRRSIGKRIAGIRIVDFQTQNPTSVAGAVLANLLYWGVIFLVVMGGVVFMLDEPMMIDRFLDFVFPAVGIWSVVNFVSLFNPPLTQTLADRASRVEVIYTERMIKKLKRMHNHPTDEW